MIARHAAPAHSKSRLNAATQAGSRRCGMQKEYAKTGNWLPENLLTVNHVGSADLAMISRPPKAIGLTIPAAFLLRAAPASDVSPWI